MGQANHFVLSARIIFPCVSSEKKFILCFLEFHCEVVRFRVQKREAKDSIVYYGYIVVFMFVKCVCDGMGVTQHGWRIYLPPYFIIARALTFYLRGS